MPRVEVVLTVAALLALCCGPKKGKIGEQPSWRQQPKSQRARAFAPIVFAPNRPGVSAYNGHEEVRASSSQLADGILRATSEVATRGDRPIPQLDPRLSAAAKDLAGIAPSDSQLAYPLVEFALQRHGIIEPSPHIIVIWGQRGGDPDDVVSSLRERLPEIMNTQTVPHTRLGVGVANRGDDEECIVVAFQASYIETQPILRSLPVGGSVEVKGRVHSPYTDPTVFVTRGAGVVERPSVYAGSGGAFRTKIACGGQRGRQQVEITAIDASGSTVLANFPVWCGDAPPNRIVHEASIDDTSPVTNEADAVARMLELLNRDRKAHGLAPLLSDPRLAAVAQAHSREMRETGRVAHVSPKTGSAADRVDKAGIRTSVVLENVARAYGVAQAQAGLMNSPGHRANILSREATHVGFGVIFGDKAPGRHEMFITQVFARLPANLSASQARSVIQKSVLKARPKLVVDSDLSSIASEFAARIARGETTQSAGARASAQLREARSSYLSVSTLVTAVADVEAFEPGSGLEPGVSHVGVGVAKGDHEVMGDGAFYIVLLLAQQ